MNALESVETEIRAALPDAWSRLRRPRNPEGEWWLDVQLGKRIVAVQWLPAQGFGVSLVKQADGFGEGPVEIFDSPAGVPRTVVSLLKDPVPTEDEEEERESKDPRYNDAELDIATYEYPESMSGPEFTLSRDGRERGLWFTFRHGYAIRKRETRRSQLRWAFEMLCEEEGLKFDALWPTFSLYSLNLLDAPEMMVRLDWPDVRRLLQDLQANTKEAE